MVIIPSLTNFNYYYVEQLLVNVVAGIGIAKVLDYNMVYSQGLPNDKKVG